MSERSMTIQCEHCAKRYRIDTARITAKGNRVRCSQCKHIFLVRLSRPRILIAKDSKDFHLSVGEILKGQPYETLFAMDGEEALAKIRQHGPGLAVLDVALPKIYGFELAEMIKSDPLTKEIRVILLAAIHDKTRYKRLPESLYGADGYIEAHHVTDHLLTRIHTLLPHQVEVSSSAQEDTRPQPDAQETSDQGLCDETQGKIARLARIIISDIALYSQEKVEQGIRDGNLEELLYGELQEAQDMMRKRFSDIPLDHCKNLLEQALEALKNKDRTTRSVS